MKFYVVVNYYLGSLSFKFHEDSCINARARLIANARVYDLCARICARIFMKFKT